MRSRGTIGLYTTLHRDRIESHVTCIYEHMDVYKSCLAPIFPIHTLRARHQLSHEIYAIHISQFLLLRTQVTCLRRRQGLKMAGSGYTYNGRRYIDDDSPLLQTLTASSASPPPPYHLVTHRASSAHPHGPRSPILTSFREAQHAIQSQGQGPVSSAFHEAAYEAALASGMTNVDGLLYHHHVGQVPYQGHEPEGRSPGFPSAATGFTSPPPSARSPDAAHLVPQPLPTHTGADPGSVSASMHPNSFVPAQQAIAPAHAPASTLTDTAAVTTTATTTTTATATVTTMTTATDNNEDIWIPAQDRYIMRLRKREQKSYEEISQELEGVFQVKRDASAVRERLMRLRAWRKVVWKNDEVSLPSH